MTKLDLSPVTSFNDAASQVTLISDTPTSKPDLLTRLQERRRSLISAAPVAERTSKMDGQFPFQEYNNYLTEKFLTKSRRGSSVDQVVNKADYNRKRSSLILSEDEFQSLTKMVERSIERGFREEDFDDSSDEEF